MSKSIKLIQVNSKYGNIIIPWLRKADAINRQYKIEIINEDLFIPINIIPNDVQAMQNIYKFKILLHENNETFPSLKSLKKKKKTPSLKDALRSVIPPEFYDILPRAYDILGSIAIIEINREEQLPLRPYIAQIGNTLLKLNSQIKSVYEKAGDISGVFRTRKLKYVAGIPSTLTIYKENLCRFKIDVEKTFFTPRLAFERQRIASLKTPYTQLGWTWDMFCGVGPYLIQIAKQNPHGLFLGTDINKNAIDLAQENVSLNKLSTPINFFNLNLHNTEDLSIRSSLLGNVSRIIMNLPEKNLEFLQYLPPFLHPEGTLLHIYQFTENQENSLELARKNLVFTLKQVNIQIQNIVGERIVKPFSPALDTTVIDAIICRDLDNSVTRSTPK